MYYFSHISKKILKLKTSQPLWFRWNQVSTTKIKVFKRGHNHELQKSKLWDKKSQLWDTGQHNKSGSLKFFWLLFVIILTFPLIILTFYLIIMNSHFRMMTLYLLSLFLTALLILTFIFVTGGNGLLQVLSSLLQRLKCFFTTRNPLVNNKTMLLFCTCLIAFICFPHHKNKIRKQTT